MLLHRVLSALVFLSFVLLVEGYAADPVILRYYPSTESSTFERKTTVEFSIGVEDGDGDLRAAEWFFGSGNSVKWHKWEDHGNGDYYEESKWSYTFDEVGEFHIFVYANDDAGNQTSLHWQVTIPNHTPTATRANPTKDTISVFEGTDIDFIVQAEDDDKNLAHVEWFIGSQSQVWNDISGSNTYDTWTHTFDEPGTYKISAYVYDEKNAKDFVWWEVQVKENVPPTITRDSPNQTEFSTIVGTRVEFSVDVEDENANLKGVEWYVNKNDLEFNTLNGSEGSDSWSYTFNQEGHYEIFAYVYDLKDHEAFIVWKVNVIGGSVRLISPNGGEQLQTGQEYTIRWESSGNLDPDVELQYSTDNGNHWQVMTIVKNTGSYKWTVHPDAVSSQFLLKVIGYRGSTLYLDVSDNPLSVESSYNYYHGFENLSLWNTGGLYGQPLANFNLGTGRLGVRLPFNGQGEVQTGPGGATYIYTKENRYQYGTYIARLKAGRAKDFSQSSSGKEGLISGFFTFWTEQPTEEKQQIGRRLINSEIDFEFMGHDHASIYLAVWLHANEWNGEKWEFVPDRVGRVINMRTGEVREYTPMNEPLSGPSPTPLPESDRIHDFDCTSQFYTYGFTWEKDRIEFFMYSGDKRIHLWTLNDSSRIPTHPAHVHLNVWHTDDWFSEWDNDKNGTLSPPQDTANFEIDWLQFNANIVEEPTPIPSTPTPPPGETPTQMPTSTPQPPIITPTPSPTPTSPPQPTHVVSPTPSLGEGPVNVFDNPFSLDVELTGQTDFDNAEEAGLTIMWNDQNQTQTKEWSVFVREGLGGPKFLARVDGDVNQLDWINGSQLVQPEFRSGPDFNSAYRFRVVRLDNQFTPDDYLDQTGYVGLNLEGKKPVKLIQPAMPFLHRRQIEVYDDILGGINMALVGEDIDEPNWRALQIAWNFDVDPKEVQDYRVLVRERGEGFQFLGQTHSGEITYFWWTQDEAFDTQPDFQNGPQDGKEYQFRVVKFGFDGSREGMNSGWINYRVQE